jgi:hypothetical protein
MGILASAMKPFLALVATILPILSVSPALAQSYTYTEKCWYSGKVANSAIMGAKCEITEIRNDSDRSLEERDIRVIHPSGKHYYALRSWFTTQGVRVWDTNCQCEYFTRYMVEPASSRINKISGLGPNRSVTRVSRNLWIRQISWD